MDRKSEGVLLLASDASNIDGLLLKVGPAYSNVHRQPHSPGTAAGATMMLTGFLGEEPPVMPAESPPEGHRVLPSEPGL